jgi:hypothetical protein
VRRCGRLERTLEDSEGSEGKLNGDLSGIGLPTGARANNPRADAENLSHGEVRIEKIRTYWPISFSAACGIWFACDSTDTPACIRIC